MALDFNCVKFLLWSKNLGVAFDRTLTLGHQGIGLSCSRGKARRALQQFNLPATEPEIDLSFQRKAFTELFADDFLKLLGAKEVVSVDRSDFEGATLLHDLNQPFPEQLRETFDLVIDGGTLEHIYNYPEALSNCLDLLRVGGHFVTITPASGQMGHGFYQFSPELFFRVFSAERGFILRKIIGYDISKVDSPFYEIKDPATSMQRTASVGNKPIQLAVLAQKITTSSGILEPPQQSDYVAIWENHEKKQNPESQANSEPDSLLTRLRIAVNPYWPSWLRNARDTFAYRIRWGLSKLKSTMMSQKHFQRLSNEDIFNERPTMVESAD